MEFIDIVDEKGNLTGERVLRKEAHKKGLLHSTIHVLVYNSRNQIFLQKRADIKDFDAGKWDFVLGGHVSSGETPEIAVLKELGEEYGIKTTLENLEFFKTRRFLVRYPEKNWQDNEINFIYLLKYDLDVNKLKLQKEEVSEVRWFSIEQLEKDISDPVKRLNYCKYRDYSYYFEMIDYLREKIKSC
ncbi:MAG: NUDIX domain-containing protein [Candidatus Nanoarchaeia archaeon]|nr:NUDIX domain-containing protein [Candidatus Nanoarchaeia archaeon]MDD5740952.1 NUDIX domain-containing protein [Candidatus Nanoarchaeia archaeon]